MSGERHRSREARALAEEALLDLISASGVHASKIVVIGGLTPELLAPEAETPHLGTTDVDILIELGLVYERDDSDFQWLEEALRTAGFVTQRANIGWRWTKMVDGFPVVVDVLCDVPDLLDQEVALPGTQEVSANNLSGPAAALNGTVERVLTSPGSQGNGLTVRFAGLGGYLLAKVAALVRRQLPKDFYDFAFVVLYNPEGPRGAARAARAALPHIAFQDFAGDVLAATRDFDSVTSRGPIHFASEMQLAGSDLDREVLLQDAVAAIAQFAESFESA